MLRVMFSIGLLSCLLSSCTGGGHTRSYVISEDSAHIETQTETFLH